MTTIEMAVAGVIVSPIIAYVLARVAAAGWFCGKLRYQRRLIERLSRGDYCDGE